MSRLGQAQQFSIRKKTARSAINGYGEDLFTIDALPGFGSMARCGVR
jgi:hypothetical protein